MKTDINNISDTLSALTHVVIGALSLCTLFFCTSCDLAMQPISEIGDGAFYKNGSEVNAAVVACYNGLQAPMRYEWMLTELRSDNARLHTSATTSTDRTMQLDFDQSRISATSEHVYNYWKAVYHNIARCNAVLTHLDAVDEAALRTQYEAEARFIRGYHYFNLVRLFGPVFIVDKRLDAVSALNYERSSIEEVYQFLTSDLQFAADSLPATYAESEKGRATSWAAKGLLAKVRMTQGLYDAETKTLLEDIVKNGGFSLMPTYASVFDTGNELNDEILFTIRYTSGGMGLGSPFGNWFAPLQSGASVINGGGNGYNYPTDDLVSAYSSSDLRRDVTFALDYTNERGQVIDRRYVTKYLSPVVLKEDGDKDWPVLRYADILLLYAEVLNEIDGPAAALPYINLTRERAGLTALTSAQAGNRHQMRMALEKERRLELAYENHRWFDLIRTNRAIEVMTEHWANESYYTSITAETGPIVLTESLILLPMPQKEIDIQQDITQNPGY